MPDEGSGSNYEPIQYPIRFGGLNTFSPAARIYPDAVTASNVRFTLYDTLLKRSGFTTYNATAMPATTRAITGVFQFNRRNTTTRYTIVTTQEKIFVVPTSGAWTTLVSGLTASATDYWDAAVFNNQLVLTNGVDAVQITDGTAGGTNALAARVWATKTSSTQSQQRAAGFKSVGKTGSLYAFGGQLTGLNALDATQEYDPYGDAWHARQRTVINRIGASGAEMFGKMFCISGYTGTALVASCERYDPATDIWTSFANVTVARSEGQGWGISNRIHAVEGQTTWNTASTGTTTNYRYNPVTDTWSTVTAIATARGVAAGFEISNLGYIAGGLDTGGLRLATVEGYDGNADALTAAAEPNITTATYRNAGTGGNGDGTGYATGGDTAGSDVTTAASYGVAANAWTAETALGTARSLHVMGVSDRNIFAHGQSALERFNTSPAAPVALYVEAYKGYLFLARTSSFPSRLWFSAVGDSTAWDPFAFIDVNPDDGHWITGLFVFNGRLYVSKADSLYEVAGDVFDPDPATGNQQIIQLENVPGAVSNRSIVVTDHGVYYLGKDAIRVFDGSRSRDISSEKLSGTIAGYVNSRFKYCQGVWVKKFNEIWFTFTSTGSTHDTILCWNYVHRRWTSFTGMNCESIALVENANDVDQILFGTGLATDGKLYLADSGTSDNAANIVATYQTGWFSPASALNATMPKNLYLWITRQSGGSAATLTVRTRTMYNTTNQTSDDLPLSQAAGNASGGQFFFDANDNRARIELGWASSASAISVQFTDTSTNTAWEVQNAILTGMVSVGGGAYPV